MLAQGKRRQIPWNCESKAISTVWLLGFTRRSCGSQKKFLWPHLARKQLVLLFDYGGHLQEKYRLGRIWNCTLAELALLHVSFPTSSPSGDQVLQIIQQLYCISGPKMEEMSENSLKVPCLIQAVLGRLLKCGCTCANRPWVGWSSSGIAKEQNMMPLLHSHAFPHSQQHCMWFQYGKKGQGPLTPAWTCLLLVQQEMLWDLCSIS